MPPVVGNGACKANGKRSIKHPLGSSRQSTAATRVRLQMRCRVFASSDHLALFVMEDSILTMPNLRNVPANLREDGDGSGIGGDGSGWRNPLREGLRHVLMPSLSKVKDHRDRDGIRGSVSCMSKLLGFRKRGAAQHTHNCYNTKIERVHFLQC